MQPFDLFGRWFWLLCIVVQVVNLRAADRRMRQKFAGDAQRIAAGTRLVRQFAVIGALPWLVMGWGVLAGGVPGVWSYFRPQDGNPYVWAWFASTFALSLAFAVWVFAFDGVRKMAEFELTSLLRGRAGLPVPPWAVRLMAAVGPFFVLFWIWMVSHMNAPIPR
jgi:hypothetical protein